jgi:hypothetical protein
MKPDYKIYKSKLILVHHKQLINDAEYVNHFFKKQFPDKDSTWGYELYNVFCATAPSPLWHDLFTELKIYIREYIGNDNRLWLQGWLNFHMPDQVLDWHNHISPYHGYISIDPKKTETVFENYKIVNELGNIYIGPGHRQHKVEVIESFDTPRITIGFNVTDTPRQVYRNIFSLMPI